MSREQQQDDLELAVWAGRGIGGKTSSCIFSHGPSLGHPRAARAESFWRGAPLRGANDRPRLHQCNVKFCLRARLLDTVPRHPAPPCPHTLIGGKTLRRIRPSGLVARTTAGRSRARGGRKEGSAATLQHAVLQPWAAARAPQGGPIRVLFACGSPLRGPPDRPRLHKCSVKFCLRARSQDSQRASPLRGPHDRHRLCNRSVLAAAASARAPLGDPSRVWFAWEFPVQGAERSPSKRECKVLPPRPIAGHPLRATPQGAARPPWTAQMRCTVLPPRPIA